MALAIVVVVLLAIGFLVWLRRDSGNAGAGVLRVGDAAPATVEGSAAEAAFDRGFLDIFWPYVDRYFHNTIAGTAHPNRDGSDRISAIRECRPLEFLKIEREIDNPVDPKALAVKRKSGQQLGYIHAEVAHEIYGDISRLGLPWFAVFIRRNRQPSTGRTVGATVMLARTTEAQIREVSRL